MDKWPKREDEFNAFFWNTGKKAIGCPCVARRVSEDRIEALDSHGSARVFYRCIWRFEKVNSPEREKL